MGDEASDEALLGRAARGDERAFLLIYERHRDAVYRFVRRLSGLPELAEDVTQDCFVGLIQDPSRYQPRRASLRTFLCAVARNRAITRLRREGRESALEDEGEDDRGEPRAQPGPLECILDGERQTAVAAALARLPLLQREAIVLFEYEGLTLAETAQVAATDVGTIKSRLHRARERLRRSLAGYLAAPGAARTAGGR
jgi:RNA polymerase sigma-70 factor (ECF subfamily)